jgi:hypothetical protein
MEEAVSQESHAPRDANGCLGRWHTEVPPLSRFLDLLLACSHLRTQNGMTQKQNHLFLLGYSHCLAQSCGGGNIFALPLDDGVSWHKNPLPKSCVPAKQCLPHGPAVMESSLKMIAKVCARLFSFKAEPQQ